MYVLSCSSSCCAYLYESKDRYLGQPTHAFRHTRKQTHTSTHTQYSTTVRLLAQSSQPQPKLACFVKCQSQQHSVYASVWLCCYLCICVSFAVFGGGSLRMESYEEFCQRSLARLQAEGQAMRTVGVPLPSQDPHSTIRFHGRAVLPPLVSI